MERVISGYLFSKEERYVDGISLILLGIIGCVVGIASYFTQGNLHNILPYFYTVVLIAGIWLVFDHFCNKKYRFARYTIALDAIKLQVGDKKYILTTNENFFVSIVQLYQPKGKSYGSRPYIIL